MPARGDLVPVEAQRASPPASSRPAALRAVEAAVACPQPDVVEPQLATATVELPSGPWLYEQKLDGMRLLVHARRGTVRLLSRNQRLVSDRFPEVVDAVGSSVTDDLIADGELVALDGERESFSHLQSRLAAGPGRRAHIPVRLYLFDLLHLAGHDLRSSPLAQRKALLAQALPFCDTVRYTDDVAGDHEQQAALLDEACRRGWEGLIAKRPESRYRPGRSTAWRKLKCAQSGVFIVVGFTVPKSPQAGFGALLLGHPDAHGVVRYVGKVGSGFSDRARRTIRSFLGRIEVPTPPFAGAPPEGGLHFVEPIVTVEVDHAGWTPAGRLRHPRFVGVVLDRAEQAVVSAIDDA